MEIQRQDFPSFHDSLSPQNRTHSRCTFVEILITLRRLVERNHRGIDRFRDLHLEADATRRWLLGEPGKQVKKDDPLIATGVCRPRVGTAAGATRLVAHSAARVGHRDELPAAAKRAS
jgi:hypothetical protein